MNDLFGLTGNTFMKLLIVRTLACNVSVAKLRCVLHCVLCPAYECGESVVIPSREVGHCLASSRLIPWLVLLHEPIQ